MSIILSFKVNKERTFVLVSSSTSTVAGTAEAMKRIFDLKKIFDQKTTQGTAPSWDEFSAKITVAGHPTNFRLQLISKNNEFIYDLTMLTPKTAETLVSPEALKQLRSPLTEQLPPPQSAPVSYNGPYAVRAPAFFKAKTPYSPENFKSLLLKKHPFPPNIIVTGDLNLSGCTRLTSLPERLTVEGTLDLSGCAQLTSLPEGLTVGGGLDLSDCTGLTSLPKRLTVEGTLNLSGCTRLTSLPNWITTLGPRADGNTRQIYLEGIGLSEVILNSLRGASAPGIQFHFFNAASVPTQTFPNLDNALIFWVKATNDKILMSPPITINSEVVLRNVLDFLSKLIETVEYKNFQARPVLAKRVIEVFSLMAKYKTIKDRAFQLIHDGLITCDDRISALEKLELMIFLWRKACIAVLALE